MFSIVILLLLAAVSGTVSAVPGTAACRVELVPPEPDHAWIAAATALDSELRRSRPSDRDCTRIVVRTNIERPTVAVFIADGRSAVRALNTADDLWPHGPGLDHHDLATGYLELRTDIADGYRCRCCRDFNRASVWDTPPVHGSWRGPLELSWDVASAGRRSERWNDPPPLGARSLRQLKPRHAGGQYHAKHLRARCQRRPATSLGARGLHCWRKGRRDSNQYAG